MAEDHYSLSAKVFHSIREDILNGKYQANEELKEKNIGDDLGVSRTPVREALRQLELEGLVHIIPNKGAFVEGVTLQDIKDEMVYEACASKELTRVLRDYHHYLQRIRRITLEEKARAHASINEHRAIAEALKARDARTAEECARLHIRNTISNMDKVGWENLMK